MEPEVAAIEKLAQASFILSRAHCMKAVKDFHETMVDAASGIILRLVCKFVDRSRSTLSHYTFSKPKGARKINSKKAGLNQKANTVLPCGERLPEYA
jgi:adenosine/AMP kinase